jgi:hypothetical protein
MLEEFSLPTTITVLSGEIAGKHIAHCLDFDLIETAETEDDACSRLIRTVKTYVEFGLGKGWGNCIRHRAPQRFWDVLKVGIPAKFGAPILIADVSVPVIKAEEPGYEALAAAGAA